MYSTLPACGASHVTPLDTGWSLTRTAAGTAVTPDALTAQHSTWQPAVVPGTVAAAFPTADPTAWTGLHDLDSADWWYRCTFPTPDPASAVRQTLTLHGLATIATVWLNGHLVAQSDNMFTATRLDVTSILHQPNAENELLIHFTALHTTLAQRRPRPRWRTKLVERQQLRWIRTTLLGRLVEWGDSPQPVGPWRPITLETHHALHLDDAKIHPRVEGTDGVLDVVLHCQAHDLHEETGATLHIGTVAVPLTITRDGDSARIHGTARIPDVALWWPHTHGDQPRYHASVSLTRLGQPDIGLDLGTIAFRTITLDTTDGAFTLSVNGVRIFCRGACWTSLDITRLVPETSAYRDALTLARDGGMNMLRVGGTMIYEGDDFYELCDELGILVWQDFMFANMDYPDDPTFLASVREEVRQFLRRLQTRPCLAVLCGNSEVQQQASMLGMPRELWNAPLFAEHLPAFCAEDAPAVPYWPSSPSGGTFPFQVNSGDAHYFGYGPYLRSFDDVRSSGVRFASETLAFANVPSPDTVDLIPGQVSGAVHHPAWKRGVPRDAGATWDFEDVREHYFEQLFNIRPFELRRRNAERYVAMSRVVSGEVMYRAIGAWRRADSICHGALIWFYRDLRLGAGWGLIDVLGRPKAAYYYFRRASTPVAVFLSDEGLNGLRVDVANDKNSPLDTVLHLTLYRNGELPIINASTPVTVAPHATVAVNGDALLGDFADSTYAYRFGPASHDLCVATLTDRATGAVLGDAIHFPTGLPSSNDRDPGLEASVTPRSDGGYDLVISTRFFAQSVEIQLQDHRPTDNYFHIPPGSTRTIQLFPRSAASAVVGTVTPLNAPSSTRIVTR